MQQGEKMDLVNELIEKRNQMRPALEQLRQRGRNLAKAEYDYKVALRKEVLRERAKETAVGVINMISYGEDTVAMLRLKRDTAKTEYEVMQEVVLMLKLDIRILDNQISREWHNNDN